MTTPPDDDDRGSGFAATDVGLLATPLDSIAEDHERVRNMCALIEYIADHPETHPEIVAQVSSFVRSELPALIADESQDLLPLMQRRCQPEDEIDRLRTRLDAEHDTAMYLLPDALKTLDALQAGQVELSEASLHLLRNFAAHLHRHLIFENAILIPLARARLTPDDLKTLRARMTMRRGPTQSTDDDDAT